MQNRTNLLVIMKQRYSGSSSKGKNVTLEPNIIFFKDSKHVLHADKDYGLWRSFPFALKDV